MGPVRSRRRVHSPCSSDLASTRAAIASPACTLSASLSVPQSSGNIRPSMVATAGRIDPMITNLAPYFVIASLVVLSASSLVGCGGVPVRFPYGDEVTGTRAFFTSGGGVTASLGLTEFECLCAACDSPPGRSCTVLSCRDLASSTLISINFEFVSENEASSCPRSNHGQFTYYSF